MAIVLYFLMQGIILSGRAAGSKNASRCFGLPGDFDFVGIALIINGVFVAGSKAMDGAR